MVKKWGYILISVWLINALVCFHPANPFERTDYANETGIGDTVSDSTLFDLLVNHLAKSDDDDTKHHKHVTRHRYIVSRVHSFSIQLPSINLFNTQNLAAAVVAAPCRFWQNKVLLPPHYNYLFRLSPF